jgi:hypothetical protein
VSQNLYLGSTTTDAAAVPTAPTRALILFEGLDTSGVVEPEEDLDAKGLLNEMKVELTLFKREGKMPLTTADGQYSNPLEWWKKHANRFPVLSHLARELLAIPATSAPSEHIWSHVSAVLNMKHSKLKPQVAAGIMYIPENLALLRKHYVDIAVEEGGEVERAIIELEKKYLPPLRS